MATFRKRALDEAASHQPCRFYADERPVSEYFGQNVLDFEKMRGYMSQNAFNAVQECVINGAQLDRSVADEIAEGMKEWAIEMGATHYTHLFQPLTDSTAEKHEAFVCLHHGWHSLYSVGLRFLHGRGFGYKDSASEVAQRP